MERIQALRETLWSELRTVEIWCEYTRMGEEVETAQKECERARKNLAGYVNSIASESSSLEEKLAVIEQLNDMRKLEEKLLILHKIRENLRGLLVTPAPTLGPVTIEVGTTSQSTSAKGFNMKAVILNKNFTQQVPATEDPKAMEARVEAIVADLEERLMGGKRARVDDAEGYA